MTEHLEVPHLRFLLAVAVTLLIRIIFITQAHTLGAFIPKGWKITPPAYRCSLPALQPFDNKCNEIHGEEIL